MRPVSASADACEADDPKRRPDFVRFLDSADEGLERLWQAIEGGDERLLINTLRELRSFERLFFLRFG